MPANIPLPENEGARLECLRGYQILDTLRNESFDRFTRLAAQLLDTPVALISLIDSNRQWLKSAVGIDSSEFPREVAFCAHTICAADVMVVEDARCDDRFRDNPFVTGTPAILAYAGAPIISPEGYAIGTIGVVDFETRTFDAKVRGLLRDFAAAVMDLIESHRNTVRAHAAERHLIDAVDALADGFVLYDADDRLMLCNNRYREIYKESADLLVAGASFEEIIRAGVARGQYPEAIGSEEAWVAERLKHHRNPPNDPIEQELPGDRWLRIHEGRTYDGGLAGFRIDITELKRNQRKLSELAWTDSLTKSLSRHRFFELASAEISRMRRRGTAASLLAIDIDNFKQINDRYGHAAGDRVLIDLVSRWGGALREYDLLGRLGGEEFVVFLPETDRRLARIIAERLRCMTAAEPVEFDDVVIDVTTSIGIALCGPETESPERAVADADKALYEAKNSGRNRVCLDAA